jgi:hypothetical protein
VSGCPIVEAAREDVDLGHRDEAATQRLRYLPARVPRSLRS